MIPILTHIAAAGAGAGIALLVLLRLLSRPDHRPGEYPLPTWSDQDR